MFSREMKENVFYFITLSNEKEKLLQVRSDLLHRMESFPFSLRDNLRFN